MLTLNISSLTLLCHCNVKIWLVKSKPIRSNATIPTSLLRVLCHCKFLMIRGNEYFFAQMTSSAMCYVIDHPFPIKDVGGWQPWMGVYIYTCQLFFKLKVCCYDWYLRKHPADFQRFLTTFQTLPKIYADVLKTVWQGAKKVTFTACHSGKLKLTFSSPNIISTSPRNVLMSRLISQSFCNLNSSKNFTCPLGKLITEFTSPIAKPTSPGLSDTTFFARWFEHF